MVVGPRGRGRVGGRSKAGARRRGGRFRCGNGATREEASELVMVLTRGRRRFHARETPKRGGGNFLGRRNRWRNWATWWWAALRLVQSVA